MFLLQPNPDDSIHYASVRGTRAYGITGERGSCRLLTFTAGANMLGMTDDPSLNLGELDADTLALGPDGSFEILLSSEPPTGHGGRANWWSLDTRTEYILARTRSYDWGSERDPRLATERIGGGPLVSAARSWSATTSSGVLHLAIDNKLAQFMDRFAIREQIDLYIDLLNHRDWQRDGEILTEDFVWTCSARINKRIESRRAMVDMVSTVQQYQFGCGFQMGHGVVVDEIVRNRARAPHLAYRFGPFHPDGHLLR